MCDSDEYDNDSLFIINSSSIYTAQSNPHTVLFCNGNVLAHGKIQLVTNSTQQILTFPTNCKISLSNAKCTVHVKNDLQKEQGTKGI